MDDVIFYEAFQEEQEKLKSILPRAMKARFTVETIQERKDKLPEGRILCVRTQSIIPESWYGKFEAVLTRSQGYDHLLRMFKDSRLPPKLGYLGPYCSRAVAEHAVMNMFLLTKKFKSQLNHFIKFDRDGLTGVELPGRKVLVVGVGEIGSQIVKLTKALDMDVKGVDIVPKKPDLEYVALNTGIMWAEIIFCALPLTAHTNGLLNYAQLSQSKEKPYFINISRGEISPIDDLIQLLDENSLRGISLDVYQNESMVAEQLRSTAVLNEPTQSLLNFSFRENVICTPHNAFNTEESVIRKARVTVLSLEDYLNRGEFPYPVPVQ